MALTLEALSQSLLKIRPGERRRTGWMFLLLLSLVGGFITGRIIRDALFLDLPNVKAKLPIMYVAAAAAVAALTAMVTRVDERRSRTRFMAVAIVVMIATLLGARLLLANATPSWFPYAFYIWVDAFGAVMIVQFWTFAQELFNAREAKRLFAVIGGGGVIANIVVGLVIGENARTLGLANLVFVFVCCMLASLVALFFARRAARDPHSAGGAAPALVSAPHARRQRDSRGGSGGARPSALDSRYLRLIALVTVCTFLVTTLGDYAFKLIVSEAIADRASRAAYFGTFYGVTGVLSAFIQFFVTSRLLERAGILPALLLLPVSLLGGGIAVGLLPSLLTASLLKGGENTLRYTINDATTQLLYLPIAREARARAKGFIDGILRPLAIAAAGAGLFALAPVLDYGRVATVLVGLSGVWVVLIVLLRHEYLKTLLTTLKQRRLDFDGVSYHAADEGTLRTFQETLAKGSPEEVLTVLDLISSANVSGPQAEALVLPLFVHADDDVKVAALAWAGLRGRPELAARITGLFDGQSDSVRAAAIGAYCRLAREDAAMTLERFLDDESLLIQGATVAGLIKNGGLDGVLTAADRLKSMIVDPSASVRERAAWVLGEIAVSGFYRPLVVLLSDPSELVQATAIASAAKLGSQRLLGPLLERLGDERVAALVVDALSSYGAEIEPDMIAAFKDPAQSPLVREQLCRVLMRLGGKESVRVLIGELSLGGDRLRTLALAAAARIVLRSPAALPERGVIERCIVRELEGYYQALVIAHEVGDISELLAGALRTRGEDALARLFSALGFAYPQKTLEIVQQNLSSSDGHVRANAIEVVDNLLSADHKTLILPLLDEGLVQGLIEKGPAELRAVRQSRDGWLRELLHDPEPWIVVSALHGIGSARLGGVERAVADCLEHRDPWVRETALWALRSLLPMEQLPPQAGRLIGDEVERVRHFGEHVLAELKMISNVEKVLFLKKIDLFRRIRGDDLARIANIAEEISFEANEMVFGEGEVGEALYLIVTGRVKIHKGDIKLAELGDRQCFGEISILDSEPRSATVTALEPLLALKIKRDDFSEIMNMKPEIAQGVIKVLCGRLRSANKR